MARFIGYDARGLKEFALCSSGLGDYESMAAARTERTNAAAAIANAEPRRGGVGVADTQQASPVPPFKASLTGEIGAAHSPQPGPTNEARLWRHFASVALISVLTTWQFVHVVTGGRRKRLQRFNNFDHPVIDRRGFHAARIFKLWERRGVED